MESIFMYKTLIEEGSFDLIKLFYSVSEEARKEKNAVPPINQVLYWWTRKPLIVARAVILASTLTDIDVTRKLLGLSNDRRAYKYAPNMSAYKERMKRDSRRN